MTPKNIWGSRSKIPINGCWLLCRMQDDIEWEVAPISATAPKLVMEIENRLIEEEWLIKTWSPVHLRNLLESYYFKNGVKSVSALKVWQDACQYLYMPRLINDQVLRSTIEEAIKSTDFFVCSGERDDHYEGFAFGRSATVYLDESCLLIAKDEALNYQQHLDAERKAAEQAKDEKPDHRTGSGSSDSGGTEQPKKTGQKGSSDEEPMAKAMSHFYGSLALDPEGEDAICHSDR